MSTCRNQLMNEGKPYPRSGCQICGSMFGRTSSLICSQGVLPNPPAGSNLEPRHYINVGPSEPRVENKYGVIYTDYIHHSATEGDERSRTNPGHGYPAQPAWNEPIETFKELPNEQALIDWTKRNGSISTPKKYRAVRFQELQVQTEVTVKLG